MIENATQKLQKLVEELQTLDSISGHTRRSKRSARRWMGKIHGHDFCNDPVMKILIHGSKNTLAQFEDNNGWKSMIFTY
jgi:hypothetical protein